MLWRAGASSCLWGNSCPACHRRHRSLGPIAGTRSRWAFRQNGLERGQPLAPGVCRRSFYLSEKTEAYEILGHPEGDRLILFATGNEPKLADSFARAELKRGSCAPAAASTASADWVTSAEHPPCARSDRASSKGLVFMQLFRFTPHYVMRCGPIDLVPICPRRLR